MIATFHISQNWEKKKKKNWLRSSVSFTDKFISDLKNMISTYTKDPSWEKK
jgi:hypothetical protein